MKVSTIVFACLASMAAGPVAAAAETMALAALSHIHGIAFDAASPGDVFVATHYGLFKVSPEGQATQVSTDRNDYMGFSLVPGASTLLASGHPEMGGNLGVITSRDGGASWSQLAPGVQGPVDFHAMTVSKADSRRVYGLFAGIQVSEDAGLSWNIAGPAPGQVIDLAASAQNVAELYAGTATGLMKSTDSGASWALLGPANVPVSLVETSADGSLFAFLVGSGLFKMSAEHATWSAVAVDLGATYFLHLAVDPSDSAHLVAVTQESQVLESADGGTTWAPFGS